MHIKIFLFLVKCSFFFAESFVGQNVRLANEGEFNFIVSFKKRNHRNHSPENDHLCSGSMISMKDVLTTSHGLQRVQMHSYEITVGSVDLRCNTKRYPAWWVNYQQWATKINVYIVYEMNDIAITRLTEEVPDEIIPVNLLPVPFDTLYGVNITVAGWGKTITGVVSRYMQIAGLTIMTPTECKNKLNVFINYPSIYVPSNIFCSTADPFVLSTSGDSGSPVLFMDLIVAVNVGAIPNVLPPLHPRQNVRETNEGEFNFVVSIKKRNAHNQEPEKDHRCTGSMISVKDALTTSHGLQNAVCESFEMIVGSNDLRCNTKRYPAWWINYKQWSANVDVAIVQEIDDIAVIRLTEAVPNEVIPVIILPLPCDTLYERNITVAGWGKTISNHFPRYMQNADLVIMTPTECKRRINLLMRYMYPLPYNMLCSAADPFVLSTSGDSGSPVLLMGLIVAVHVGVVPTVLPDIHPNKINVHLAIWEFIEFIENMFNLL